ncbi:MAG: cupin domain-containing protein [Polyangiaceae bacterium]
MSEREPELPEFLSEACADDVGARATAGRLASDLPQLLRPLPALGRARLLSAVERLPLRYAPFFERIGELWDLPPSHVEALLARAEEPSVWRKPGLPGVRVVDVEGGERVRKARVTLAQFAPGLRFPSHRHPGPEALLVLEGRYEDQRGRVVNPGDLHCMQPGSEHWFRVGREAPCVAASVQFGLEFTGFWMRLAVRLFG